MVSAYYLLPLFVSQIFNTTVTEALLMQHYHNGQHSGSILPLAAVVTLFFISSLKMMFLKKMKIKKTSQELQHLNFKIKISQRQGKPWMH